MEGLIGPASARSIGLMPERFESFDLKITKLTGGRWDRENLHHLAQQLVENQGQPRASIENRIIICFNSVSSDVNFLKDNQDLIILTLLELVENPYKFGCWLTKYQCWSIVALLKQGTYYDTTQGLYYEHPIGLGLREPGKAAFENWLIRRVARMTNRLQPNPDIRTHGNDGRLRIDREQLLRFPHP